jgi:RimJ/RimL family protein N-acetyltransferase
LSMVDALTARRVCSGFIDEGRRREGGRSNGQPRIFICMGIVREEWDVQRGRKRPFH